MTIYLLILLTVFFFCLSDCILNLTPNVTVDINGRGNSIKINKAIEDAPINSLYRYVIYIKRGVYTENVIVPKQKQRITIVGDEMEYTIISGSNSNGTNYSITDSATLAVYGDMFFAMNLTVENTAGSKIHQAVALLSSSQQSAFYNLVIKGYQDSLYVKDGPQFYRECYIYGTIDFIFGEGPAIFQSCQIIVRQALESHSNTITANGCMRIKNCGFSFHLCNITGDKDLNRSKSPAPTYLGRPWKIYSKTVFMQSHMTEVINPMGWLRWDQTYEKTLFYGEFNNSGVGAAIEKRVKWPGVHSFLDRNMANKFTVSQFIDGEKWLSNLSVPHVGGLV